MPIHSPVPIRASSYLPFGSANAEVRTPSRREGKVLSQKFSRDMTNLYDQTFTIASAAEKLYLEHHMSSLVPDRMVVNPRRFMREVQERTLTQPPAIIVTRPPLRRATITHSTGRLQGNTAIARSDGFRGCVDSQKGERYFENSSGLVAVHEMRTDLVEGDAFLDLCVAVEGTILDSVSEKRKGQGGHPPVSISTSPGTILRRKDAMCPLRAVDCCGAKDRSTGLSEERLVALIAKLMSFPEDTGDSHYGHFCSPLSATQPMPTSIEDAVLPHLKQLTVPSMADAPVLVEKKSAIEEAILRSSPPSETQSDPLLAPRASTEISQVSAIEEALISTTQRALSAEPIPCIDDIPEIPDEDTQSYTSLFPPEQLLSPPTPPSPSTHAKHPTTLRTAGSRKFHKTRVVPEKAKRTKRGLVKQYMTLQTKTRPCQMGRTSLCKIPEKMPLYLIPCRQGAGVETRKNPQVSTMELKGSCRDENASASAWMYGDKTFGARPTRARTSSFSTTKSVLVPAQPV